MEKDMEKDGSAPIYDSGHQDFGSTVETRDGTKFSRFVDSFRRNHNARMVTLLTDADGKPLPDQPPAEPALAMKLKGRHLQMIAIGGSIGDTPDATVNGTQNIADTAGLGTGLFIGSGSALATGGPAALVICYGMIGIMLFCTVHALGELAVIFPVAGSFAVYSSRFIDPAWGFAMAWK